MLVVKISCIWTIFRILTNNIMFMLKPLPVDWSATDAEIAVQRICTELILHLRSKLEERKHTPGHVRSHQRLHINSELHPGLFPLTSCSTDACR